MIGSIKIAQIAGIPIKVHWSFGAIIFFIIFLTFKEDLNSNEIIFLVFGLASIFSCVLLHELGHVLVAKKYNILAQDILLTPIGGLARLKGNMIQPLQEIYISMAGPLVNLILAGIIYLIMCLGGQSELVNFQNIEVATSVWEFISLIFSINIVLFLFNLIPAFPMDGGRVFRAILNLKFSRITSTIIASLTGKLFALVFVFIGIRYSIYALILIGIFVYLLAEQEYRQELNNNIGS